MENTENIISQNAVDVLVEHIIKQEQEICRLKAENQSLIDRLAISESARFSDYLHAPSGYNYHLGE